MPTSSRNRREKVWLTLVASTVALLAAAVFTLGSLRIPLRPDQGNEFVTLFALSTFIVVALLVFSLILTRSLLRIWTERRAGQLGSRFKVKMLVGAMGVSLLPIVFLFFFSYALVNRTLNQWFPRPLELANQANQELTFDLLHQGHERLQLIGGTVLSACERPDKHGKKSPDLHDCLNRAVAAGADVAWITDVGGVVKAIAPEGPSLMEVKPGVQPAGLPPPHFAKRLLTDDEIWARGDTNLLTAQVTLDRNGDVLFLGRKLPDTFLTKFGQGETQTALYAQLKQNLRAYKREILLALMLITLLLLFTTTWVALFLSKQVTVPIQKLAEATREISRGNFDHRIETRAQDELGTLVRSFNRMTDQLGEGRKQINEFTQSLERAVEEREQRRKLMETILENIPTGVISLNSSGEVSRINAAVTTILGEDAKNAKTLTDLLGEDAARAMLHLMRRSLRMGAASREIEMATGGRLVRAAVTVSSLGPRRSNPGFVIVIDDLTDLLRAQRAAAWQEVAQRIAHEIKNPLTPIQLSAQRILRYLERSRSIRPEGTRSDLEKLAAECAGLIEREVQTLQSLVEEFSQFARFPSAKLAPVDLNPIVASAVHLFHERLEGITFTTELAESLPAVKADPELLRRVLANLIDNAAEAMEGSTLRHLRVATRSESDGDAVEIEVSDSGHGISPEDKERLFLPHFSTKERGTGLGLAIASRIIAEHNGTIRMEDNLPTGARFVIRFPAAEVPTMSAPAGTSTV
jgi:two-component system nitrogen regulation sensor histidine kinase NtrY